MLARLTLWGCLVLMVGCSQSYHFLGESLPKDLDQRLSGGTLSELLETLGPPHRLSSTPHGYVMAWEHWQIEEVGVGVGLSALGIDALQLDWGDASVDSDFILVHVDDQHRVTEVTRATWAGDVSDAASLMPLVGVGQFMDVDDLTEPLPQHHWGASMLLPLPESQNNRWRPGMGDTGIEQRGTPVGIGQRSLEFD